MRRVFTTPLALLLAGCTPAGSAPSCAGPEKLAPLPDSVDESSGVAASRRYPGVFWTHNDSGGRELLFAVDATGRLLGRVRVSGARSRDWEDIALGPCPAGDCLYIADTGDNRLRRADAVVYRIPEPAPTDTASLPAERFPFRYPAGPRDTEAFYVLPDGDLFLVTKGRDSPVTIYAYRAPLRPDAAVEVEEVQKLSNAPVGLAYRVTGAGATPDGRWVAVRSYSTVQLYRVGRRKRLLEALDPPGIDLQLLAEPQGEGVDLLDDGTIVLTSEAGPAGVPGVLSRVECRLP